MAGRQKVANMKRLAAMVDSVILAAEDYALEHGPGPIPVPVIALGIRNGNPQAVDDRTVVKWAVIMIVPPKSLWNDGPILKPINPVRYSRFGGINFTTVMTNSYKIVYKKAQARFTSEVLICR